MPKKTNLFHISLRRDFHSSGLFESKMKPSPMAQFAGWFQESVRRKIPDANAFVLATAGSRGEPSARVLLMKGFDSQGITFFTNYSSEKGRQISQNPQGEAVFFWNQLNRQIRLRGTLVKLSRKESLEYFESRPVLARLAACVSKQSQLISSRKKLEGKFEAIRNQLKKNAPALPVDWGGYQLRVKQVEFWQGRPNRLHDRIRYRRVAGKTWKKERLQP